MPTIAMDLLASPRTAKPGPVTIGDTSTMPGVRVELGLERLPLVDRAQPLRARLDARHRLRAGGGATLRARDFLGGPDDDVRLRAERAPDRVRLQAVDQRRDEDEDGDAGRDAADDERRLETALAQEPQRDHPFERHRVRTPRAQRARTRWPGSMPGVTISESPALTPASSSARACVRAPSLHGAALGAAVAQHEHPRLGQAGVAHGAGRHDQRVLACPPRRCRSRRSCRSAGTPAATRR